MKRICSNPNCDYTWNCNGNCDLKTITACYCFKCLIYHSSETYRNYKTIIDEIRSYRIDNYRCFKDSDNIEYILKICYNKSIDAIILELLL